MFINALIGILHDYFKSIYCFIMYIIVLLIFVRIIDINKFFKTNYYKRTVEGFSDLLQYDCLIEDNIYY